jgi:Ca2+-binding RTX toxin-like protein
MAKFVPQQGGWKHTLYGTDNGEWLVGYSSDDTMWANGGNDRVEGSHGTDYLDGGNGDDTLVGGTATDSLTGGKGADRFQFNAGDGWDIIQDFHQSQGDTIWVNAAQQSYAVSVEDGDTYVNFGNGDGIVIVGQTFYNSDFINFGALGAY